MGRDMGPILEEIRQLKEERDSWRRVSERLEHEKQKLLSRLQIAEDNLSACVRTFIKIEELSERLAFKVHGEMVYTNARVLGDTARVARENLQRTDTEAPN